MTEPKDLITEAKRHRIFITNKRGKRVIELPLIWAVIITLVAPQLAVLVVVGALLDIVSVGIEEKNGSDGPEDNQVE
jgi:hypothetical protein